MPASAAPAAGQLTLEVSCVADGIAASDARWLQAALRRVLAAAGHDQGALSLALVDDTLMADLHQRYKSVPGTTDVLTFDLRQRPDDPLEAEVVICVDEAARQGRRRGHPPRAEMLLYAVHGLLHLTGYDDQRPEDAQAMHAREDELLTQAGFGPIYRAGEEEPNRSGSKGSTCP